MLYKKFSCDFNNSLILRCKITRTLKRLIVGRLLGLKTLKHSYRKHNLRKNKASKIVKILKLNKSRKSFCKTNTKKKRGKKDNTLKSFWDLFKYNKQKRSIRIRLVKHNRLQRRWKKVRRKAFFYRKRKRFRRKLRYFKRKSIPKAYSISRYDIKQKKKRFMKSYSWLYVDKVVKRKRNHWLYRELEKRIAFTFGFSSVKKFRNINKNIDKKMIISAYANCRLELMLNMFLLRINVVDNIFHSNNLLRMTNHILINGKVCNYPFRKLKVNDLVTINKKQIWKYLKAFIKKVKHNKKKLKNLSIIFNVPNWIEYNYRTMQFIIYRLPKLNELKNFNNVSSLQDWTVDNKFRYNN